MSATVATRRPHVPLAAAAELLSDIRRGSKDGPDPRRVRALLHDRGGEMDLSEAREVSIRAGRGVIVAMDGDGPTLAVRARAGRSVTSIHSHGTWGALIVVEGSTRYEEWVPATDGPLRDGAVHHMVVGDTVWWPDPPGDVHRQVSGEEGVVELLVIGRSNATGTDLAEPPGRGELTALASGFVGALVEGDAPALKRFYATDVVFDANVPQWRFQLQGADDLCDLVESEEFRSRGRRLASHRVRVGESSLVIETEDTVLVRIR